MERSGKPKRAGKRKKIVQENNEESVACIRKSPVCEQEEKNEAMRNHEEEFNRTELVCCSRNPVETRKDKKKKKKKEEVEEAEEKGEDELDMRVASIERHEEVDKVKRKWDKMIRLREENRVKRKKIVSWYSTIILKTGIYHESRFSHVDPFSEVAIPFGVHPPRDSISPYFATTSKISSSDTVFMFGGNANSVYSRGTTDIFYYTMLGCSRFTVLPYWRPYSVQMKGERIRPTVVPLGNKFFIFGSRFEVNLSGSARPAHPKPWLEVLDTDSQAIYPLREPPSKVKKHFGYTPYHSASDYGTYVVEDGLKILFIQATMVFTYDVLKDTWEASKHHPALQKPFDHVSYRSVVFENVLYTHCLGRVYGFDLGTKQWFVDPVKGLFEYLEISGNSDHDYEGFIVIVRGDAVGITGNFLCVGFGVQTMSWKIMNLHCAIFTPIVYSKRDGKKYIKAKVESSSIIEALGQHVLDCLAW